MRFHICTHNHGPNCADTLREQAIWLAEGLIANGHEVGYSGESSDPDAINILWECFSVEFAKSMAESGSRYGIIATEIPDGGGWNNKRDETWPERWRGFQIAAAKADFIWSMIPEAVPLYQQMGPKAAYLEYGFSERLLIKGDHPRDIPLFFYGGVPAHRRKRINAVGCFHAGKIIGSDERDAILRRTAVVLGLKYHKKWKYTSASRIGRSILAGCAVAHEWTEKVLRPATFVPMNRKGGDWPTFVRKVQQNAKRHAEEALELYRQTMPIKETMGRTLEATL